MARLGTDAGSSGILPVPPSSQRPMRPSSLFGRVSVLLQRIAAAPPRRDVSTSGHPEKRGLDLEALRQRFTPPEPDDASIPMAAPADAARVERPAHAGPDVTWPGEASTEAWKPVLLSSEEMSVVEPVLLELAELTGEARLDPTRPTFPD